MLSLFPVVCSKFGASSLKAEVSATDVNTLISAAPLATAANKHDVNPPAAISAMRFANDVWIMHPSHEINFNYSITSSARASTIAGTSRPSAFAVLEAADALELADTATSQPISSLPVTSRPIVVI